MEAVTIFPGLEVAGPNQQNRGPVPQAHFPARDASSTGIPPYSIAPKDNKPRRQNSSPAVIDLPAPRAKERGGRGRVVPVAIAAAVAAAIVGAAVGGGLGSALSECRGDLQSSRDASLASTCQRTNSSATPTPTTQDLASSTTCLATFQTTTGSQIIDYEVIPSKNVSTLAVDCDSLQKSPQVTSQGEKFSVLCNVGFQPGTGRIDGDGDRVTLAEITTLIAYSLSDCLEACSSYTATSMKPGRDAGESCGSVVFKTNMAQNYYGNCLLLNSTVTHSPGGGICAECISATKIE